MERSHLSDLRNDVKSHPHNKTFFVALSGEERQWC